MASIKVKFRPSSIVEKEGTIFYQIIHEKKVRQLTTDYKVFFDEWSEQRSSLICTAGSERLAFIISIKERIRWDIERLTKIIHKLDTTEVSYTTDDIVSEFERYCQKYTLFNYLESMVVSFIKKNKTRTAETYRSTLNSIKRFLNNNDIMLDAVNADIMESYEAYLKSRGNTPNTTSFYMRILRSAYNRAVEDNAISNRNPFRHVYTGVDKTIKRALPIPLIRKIKALDLSLQPQMDFARDMFLMSFYLRGMSFVDMAFLRKSDLKNGSVIYRRRKTGQQLIIGWTKEMQLIIDKYPESDNEYLIPIIRNPSINERNTYRNVGYNINHNLKKIAEMIGVSIPLTLYVARHSWASAAKAKGIPLSVISEGMGHDSETTTKIYLASLDTSIIDKANSIIIKSI